MKIFTLIKLLLIGGLCVTILISAVICESLYYKYKPQDSQDLVKVIIYHRTSSFHFGYNQGVVDILRLDDTYKRIDIKRFEALRTKRFADYRR